MNKFLEACCQCGKFLSPKEWEDHACARPIPPPAAQPATVEGEEPAKHWTPNRFKGRVKPEIDKFATLKAWVHWVLKNPLDEDQRLHAMATNDLFALLGTREAQLTAKDARIAELEAKLKEARKEARIELLEEMANESDDPTLRALYTILALRESEK